MDLKFANEIIDILDYIGKKLGIAIDWSSNTILPYLKELMTKYISYKIGVSIMWIIISCIIILIFSIIWKRLYKYCKESEYEYTILDGEWWYLAICITIIIVCIIVIIYNTYIIIECKTFPEKVIYEYITSLYGSYN